MEMVAGATSSSILAMGCCSCGPLPKQYMSGFHTATAATRTKMPRALGSSPALGLGVSAAGARVPPSELRWSRGSSTVPMMTGSKSWSRRATSTSRVCRRPRRIRSSVGEEDAPGRAAEGSPDPGQAAGAGNGSVDTVLSPAATKDKSSYRIVTLPGDGIGPEIMSVAVHVLRSVGERQGIKFEITEKVVGGAAIDETGVPLPDETLGACRNSDAVLLAAIGGYKWDTIPRHLRPERGLLALRSGMGTFANLRPTKVLPQLADASTLKREIVEGVNIMIVRELTGGIYFGQPRGTGVNAEGQKSAYNTMVYSIPEIDRIARVAFEIARKRTGKLCSIDKANVLEVSQLWRQRVTELGAEEYPDIELSHMYVDNAAMQLVLNPKQFDTIVTGNLFGDVLSDISATLGGSIGMLASASTSYSGPGLFEPIHGSAPDIAGQDKANPLAQVLSVAMMLKYGLGLEAAANAVESAVWVVLDKGYRTGDIFSPGKTLVGCKRMGEALLEALDVLEVRPPVPLLW